MTKGNVNQKYLYKVSRFPLLFKQANEIYSQQEITHCNEALNYIDQKGLSHYIKLFHRYHMKSPNVHPIND